MQSALAFSIKRGGILYGGVDEEGCVNVEFIYEPRQSGTADSLQLERGTAEEAQVSACLLPTLTSVAFARAALHTACSWSGGRPRRCRCASRERCAHRLCAFYQRLKS